MATPKLAIGTLLARREAPSSVYRVTSSIGGPARGVWRLLPYRWSGREVVVVRVGGVWAGDGSVWDVVA